MVVLVRCQIERDPGGPTLEDQRSRGRERTVGAAHPPQVAIDLGCGLLPPVAGTLDDLAQQLDGLGGVVVAECFGWLAAEFCELGWG